MGELNPLDGQRPDFAGKTPVAMTLDLWPHPLTAEGRETCQVWVIAGTDVGALVRGTDAIDPDVDVVLEGELLPPEDWGLATLKGGETVTLRAGAAGGNFFRTLLSIAVIAAAFFVPGAIGLTGITANLVSAGIALGGSLIVNALFPIRPPEIGGPDHQQPDPVYSLSGGSNRARLYEPLPLVLGTHRVFPDLASQEYAEIDEDGEQFLSQIFHFGLGDLDVGDYHIGATPIGDFTGVETQLSRGTPITLVAGNVDTTAGAALTEGGVGITRRTGADTSRIGIDLTGRIFKLTNRGKTVAHTVAVDLKWWKVGAAEPGHWQRHLFAQHDEQGPYRQTWTIDLGEKATWNVKVARQEDPSEEDKVYDEVVWSALRSYQPDEGDYTGQTRLAVKVQASGQLSGRLDRLSALVKQKVPVWGGSAWGAANVVTSNPAAIFLWYARGVMIAGRPAAGVGLPDARIDLAGLGAWYAWCHARGYTCDLAIAGGMTHHAALNLIAQCGRAAVSWQTGKLGVVWEDAAHVPAGLVTPGNTVAGTFRIEYAPGDLADEVVVRYIEPDLDWQYNSVRRTRPGLSGTPQKTATVTARGVTKRENAAIECNLQVARQVYHKRRLIWEMGQEGRFYTKGSVVWITHSLIDGGEAGRLSAIESGRDLRLDREVAIDSGSWLLLRMADGTLHQSRVTARGGSPTRDVRLASALAENARNGAAVDALWRLYDNALPPLKARIIAVEPQSDRRFRFTAIDEVAAYHTLATSDLTAPFPGFRTRFPTVVGVQFSARRLKAGNVNVVELRAWLTVAGPWNGAVVRAGPSLTSLSRADELRGNDREARWTIPDDGSDQHVEIVPFAAGDLDGRVWRGLWSYDGGFAVPDVTGFAVSEKTGNIREFVWTPPEIDNIAGVRIRMSNDGETDWDSMASLADGPIGASPYLAMKPGGGTWRFTARVELTGGALSPGVSIDATLADIPASFAGSTWHNVAGVPPASLGNDGDFALRIDAGNVGRIYQKVSGAWVEIADLSQAGGGIWLSGSAAPANTLGNDGDWYFRTGTATEAGTIYTKVAGAWQELFDIGTGTWLSGSGVPASSLGSLGNFFFRTDNGFVYQKTSATVWTFLRDITGPQGDPAEPAEDGIGTESAWAVTASTVESIPANQRPLDSWGYRERATVGGLQWLPDRPSIGQKNTAVWEAERAVVGQPADGAEVTAHWSAPTRFSVTEPRQWTRIGNTSLLVNASNASSAQEYDLIADANSFDVLGIFMEDGSSGPGQGFCFVEPSSSFKNSGIVVQGNDPEIHVRVKAGSSGRVLEMHRGGRDNVTVRQVWGVEQPGGSSRPDPPPATSTRTRTFYQRGSAAPAAPSSTAFGAYSSPGGGWGTNDPGATATQGVYQVTLTQTFSSSTQSSSTFESNSWSSVTLHEAATGSSTRTRTFYQRASSAPAAPSSTAFGAYSSPGGGWGTNDPGATATQGVYQVTLTQTFSHATTQNSSTFTGNSWSSVTLHEAATGTSLPRRTLTWRSGGTIRTGETTFGRNSGNIPADYFATGGPAQVAEVAISGNGDVQLDIVGASTSDLLVEIVDRMSLTVSYQSATLTVDAFGRDSVEPYLDTGHRAAALAFLNAWNDGGTVDFSLRL